MNWFPSESSSDDALNPRVFPLREWILDALCKVLGPRSANALDPLEDQDPAEALPFLVPARARNLKASLIQAAVRAMPGKGDRFDLDEGWLLAWIDCAGLAANALEQEVFGAFLAQQMTETAAVGRLTLDRVRVMERWELEFFQFFAAFAFEFESGWRFVFEGELARREMWAYGREMDAGTRMIELGLVAPELTELGIRSKGGLRLSYRTKVWALESASEGPLGRRAFVPYRRMTPIGQQLAAALTLKSYPGFARNLLKGLEAESSLRFVEVPLAT